VRKTLAALSKESLGDLPDPREHKRPLTYGGAREQRAVRRT
jgi:hypothetical protein